MGGDMANVKNSNLKVPPLKIVLSSATSGGSDRSSSTSPSSESESLDSNLTIISENQQQQERVSNKSSEQKKDDQTNQGKLDKLARQAARGASHDQKTVSYNATIVSGNRRSHDNNPDISNNSNNESTANREQSTSSNQRITRSSQRAAQQNKSESETNGDETVVIETQETTTNKTTNNELGQRKVKRRKGEILDSEQDNNQQVPQQPPIMANICPADYQLPSQNSFELYRDIRNRPYTKMMKLSLVQPRMPQGFKDYLLHNGPYLLDGNKVGVGVGGSRFKAMPTLPSSMQKSTWTSLMPNSAPTNRRKPLLSAAAATCESSCSQLHPSYKIPMLAETPKHIKLDSPLCELFQDQERARHKMRMQHLKERERSVLSAEQEILRAYNRVAIADSRQPSHLSACTYFYYQERYHYIDEKSNYLDSINQRDSAQGRENSDSCNAENSNTDRSQNDNAIAPELGKEKYSPHSEDERVKATPTDEAGKTDSADDGRTADLKPPAKKRKSESTTDGSYDKEAVNGSRNGCDTDTQISSKVNKSSEVGSIGDKTTKGTKAIETTKCDDTSGKSPATSDVDGPGKIPSQLDSKSVSDQPNGDVISDSDLREKNKSGLIDNLHEIDEKWAKIRQEMFVRHKNESDSLYAVQCLEWEWKAKEIGACDVRVSPRIDSESVPRVDVSPLDY